MQTQRPMLQKEEDLAQTAVHRSIVWKLIFFGALSRGGLNPNKQIEVYRVAHKSKT